MHSFIAATAKRFPFALAVGGGVIGAFAEAACGERLTCESA